MITAVDDRATSFRRRPNYNSRDQLAFDVLAEFAVITSHAATDMLGEKEAETLMGLEWHHAGLASVLNIKERTKLNGPDLNLAAYAGHWRYYIYGADVRVEITDNGYRWIIRSCPWSRGSGASCSHLSQCPRADVELFAPGHLVYALKKLSCGDDACVVVVTKEGIDPMDVLKAPCICEPLPPSMGNDEMALWNHSYMGGIWLVGLRSLLSEVGPDYSMEYLEPRFRDVGKRFAERVMEVYGISPDDLNSVVAGFDLFHSSFLKRGKLKVIPDGFSIITEECPFSGEPIEVCNLFQFFYDGLLSEIDPDIALINSKRMSTGDKSCSWRIKRSKEQTMSAGNDDAVEILRIRYAKGEITEEELEKKLMVMRKLGLFE